MENEQEILDLVDGQSYIIPESDYGKAEVWLKNGTYFLFEIPLFGGPPVFHSVYAPNGVLSLLETVNNWT